MEQHEYIKRLAHSNCRFTTGKLYKHVADGKYKDDKGALFRPSTLVTVDKQGFERAWVIWQAVAPSIGEPLYNKQEEKPMTKYTKTTVTYLNGRDVKEIGTEEYLRMIKSERKAIEDLAGLQGAAAVKESKAVKRIVAEHEANIGLLTELMDANEEKVEE